MAPAVGIEASAVVVTAVVGAAVGAAASAGLLAGFLLAALLALTLALLAPLPCWPPLTLLLTLALLLALTLLLALALPALLREALKLRAQLLDLVQRSLAIVPRRALLVAVLHRLLRRPQAVLQSVQRLRDGNLARRHLISIASADIRGGILDAFIGIGLLRLAHTVPQFLRHGGQVGLKLPRELLRVLLQTLEFLRFLILQGGDLLGGLPRLGPRQRALPRIG